MISLEDIDKRWKQIGEHYELLFSALNRKECSLEEESLFWEQEAFVCIWNILIANRIEFNASKKDVRPMVIDENGTKIEIDFRIFIEENPIYFDVTHFSGRCQDLNKDKETLGVPINLKKANNSIDNPRIVAVRSQKEYLNRRITVRIAKEGQHNFAVDHVYIFIPKLDIGFGGGLDSIPTDFDFDETSAYRYKKTGIKGIILIGAYIEHTKEESRIHKKKLIARTKALPNCSFSTANLLRKVDHAVLDLGECI